MSVYLLGHSKLFINNVEMPYAVTEAEIRVEEIQDLVPDVYGSRPQMVTRREVEIRITSRPTATTEEIPSTTLPVVDEPTPERTRWSRKLRIRNRD